MIASILGLEHELQVSEYVGSIIRSFEKDMLPYEFGRKAVSREKLIKEHTSLTAKQLFNIKIN